MSTAVSVESRIERVEVTDETITAHLVDGRVISVPWHGRGACQTPHPPNEQTGNSLAPAMVFTGRTSTRTSAPKACSTAHRRDAHALRAEPENRLTPRCSRRAALDGQRRNRRSAHARLAAERERWADA